jgi:hypothetical protein
MWPFSFVLEVGMAICYLLFNCDKQLRLWAPCFSNDELLSAKLIGNDEFSCHEPIFFKIFYGNIGLVKNSIFVW